MEFPSGVWTVMIIVHWLSVQQLLELSPQAVLCISTTAVKFVYIS